MTLHDNLADEVLRRQTPEAQSFLIQTSILDRLRGSPCDAVTGRSEGQSILDVLAQEGSFVAREDDEWFVCRREFADVWRNRLFHTSFDLLPELHLRASAWYERNGFADEAIRHAMAAADYNRAARLIRDAAPDRIARDDLRAALKWLGALPDSVVQSDRGLCLLHARALSAAGYGDAAERRRWDAEQTGNG